MSLLRRNSARLGMTPTEAIEGGYLDHSGHVLPACPATLEGTTMIVPVTPNLVSAMERTALVLKGVASNGKKLNDHDVYSELANQLEDLTVDILSASSSLSLLGVTPMGARFDFAPDTKLAARVAECVSYLRNDATNLLKGGGSFSRYERTHSDNALARIKALYGLLTAAIVSQARADLQATSDLSPSKLVAVATYISEAATATS